MIQSELARPWQQPDPTQYAAMSVLSRYRGGTLRAYSGVPLRDIHAARRQPHHPALRHGPREPGPARRARRRRYLAGMSAD